MFPYSNRLDARLLSARTNMSTIEEWNTHCRALKLYPNSPMNGHDLMSLQEGEWMTDNAVNFMVSELMMEGNQLDARPAVCFWDTHALASLNNNNLSTKVVQKCLLRCGQKVWADIKTHYFLVNVSTTGKSDARGDHYVTYVVDVEAKLILESLFICLFY